MRGGLVERQALDKRYVVGPRVSALALAVQMHSPQRRERRAILARLVNAIGETCNFTMLDGSEVVYLDRVETSAGVRLHMDAGSRVPLHCTASGKLLLSALPPAQVRRLLGSGPLARYTDRTITSIGALERELAKIRASGFGTDVGEYLVGSVCLAVPVSDPHGRMCAAVAVHGPAPRMTLKKGHTFLPAMRRAANEIAATLLPKSISRSTQPRQEVRTSRRNGSMTQPVIITVAITGAVPRKKDNPAVPVTPEQQVESTHEAFEAGAALVHIHVRNPDESPGSDPELYGRVQEGVRKHCPGMIVQFSTGGRGREQQKRGAMLYLKPDMASLATGSVNFPNGIYENAPEFVEGLARTMLDNGVKPEIEVFDLAMLYNAANLVKKGLVKERPHVQFVLGVPNAMPARRSIFDFLRSELAAVLPDATWVAAGIGRHQWEVNQWCLEAGGHCRTGLEDNLRIEPDRLAASNAELVGKIADACARYDRRPATAAEARQILGLAAVH